MFKSWKTSLLGALVIASGVMSVVNQPSKLTDLQTLSQIAGGAGLLVAKDHDVHGGKQAKE